MEHQDSIVVEYAGFWRRLGAMIIDILAVISINWFVIAPWRLALKVSHIWQPEGWLGPFPVNDPFAIVTLLIAGLYFTCFWACRGQTPGSMILNIKVLSYDGRQISFSTALKRFAGYAVCVLTLGIGFLILAFDERRQGLHDKIALTVVVKVPPVKLRLPEASMG